MQKITLRNGLLGFLLLGGTALYTAQFFWACSPGNGFAETASSGGEYLGETACRSCHEPEFKDWLGSHHDHAMEEATDSTVLGDFNGVSFSSKGIVSQFFRRDGRFMVRTEGPNGGMEDFEISYTFGFFPLQQYLIQFPGGRYQCLPLAWDSREGKWFDLQPVEKFRTDDWMHWTKGSMTWNSMCADCHSTNLQKNYDPVADSYQTTWSVIDVSCEACHGPGSAHVAYVNSKAYKKGRRAPGSFTYLTANLDNRAQMDQCARCHSLRSQQSAAYDHSGHFMDHYLPEVPRPGLYHSDGQISEEVYEYGSFTQSKMFQQGVKCTNCHNPHSLKLKAEGNDLCGQCHSKKTYDTPAHHFHTIGSEGAACVSCHMPGKVYMGNDFRRDHSLRVPRPDLTAAYGTPNACANCHADQTAQWLADAVVKWYGPNRKPHYSEAFSALYYGDRSARERVTQWASDSLQSGTIRALALWYLGNAGASEAERVLADALKNNDPLVRHTALGVAAPFSKAYRLVHVVPLLADPVLAVRAQAAFVLSDVKEDEIPADQRKVWKEADKHFEKVLAAQADFAAGWLMKAQFQFNRGNFAQAEEAFKASLARDQDYTPASTALAGFYYQQNRWQEAEAFYLKVIRRDPKAAWAYYDLGLLQAENQKMPAAEANLAQAAEISGNPRYYYNWAIALQNLGRIKEAEKAYSEGIKRSPQADYLIYALAVLYYQQGDLKAAKPLARQLLQLAPSELQYQQLAQALGL
ncbi:MAG: ammonia-forming cytochrome c nitrite reductase subunit c552 [Haliscomenobacter sp.]|nr:ammonia-forming cytochrome c nitrite reductase subunit c552 [Haliscomenobacter sp.]